VGDRGFRRLVDAFGSAGAVLSAGRAEVAARCGATDALCDALDLAHRNRPRCTADAERAAAGGFALLPYGDLAYPRLLAQIPDPPAVLYLAGSLRADDERAVAVVGSRRASPRGSASPGP